MRRGVRLSIINPHGEKPKKDFDSMYMALIITLQLYFHAYSSKLSWKKN